MLLTAVSATFLIAPSAQHRMRFRGRGKEAIVKVGTLCTLIGLAFLAAAVGTAVYLVTGLLTGGTAVLWFVVPRFLPTDRDG